MTLTDAENMIKDDDLLLRYLDNESLYPELAASAARRIRELKIDRDAYAASARHARECMATLGAQVGHGSEEFRKQVLRIASTYHTQLEFAKALNYSPAYISDVLRGRREISAAFAKRLGFIQRRTYIPYRRAPKC